MRPEDDHIFSYSVILPAFELYSSSHSFASIKISTSVSRHVLEAAVVHVSLRFMNCFFSFLSMMTNST